MDGDADSKDEPKIDYFEIVGAIYLAVRELSTREQLAVLQFTWLAVASIRRNEALMVPGGFAAEQALQVEQLHGLANRVAADVPDLEMERLFREGDFEGMQRRVLQLLARGGDVQ